MTGLLGGVVGSRREAAEGQRSALASRAMWRLWGAGAFILAVAACSGGGGGCDLGCGGGCDARPYPESAPAVENGAQIRVTEHALTFLEENASGLVGQFLDGGLSFCLPEGDSPVSLCGERTCPSTGEVGCELSMELLDVNIDAVEPNRIAATAVIGGLDPETDFIEVNLLSNCIVRLGTRDNAGMPATIFADMTVEPDTRDVSISIAEEDIQIDFSRMEIEIDGASFLDIFICEGLDLLTSIDFIRDLLFDNVAGPLLSTVTDLTDEFLCRGCTSNADCPRGATCGAQGDLQVCLKPNDGGCVPAPLGFEGFFDFGTLVASISPGLEAELAIQLKAHGYADAFANGLSIGMKGGLFGEKHECVPAVPPPAQLVVPPSQVLRANTSPRGTPYHVGVGISKAFLDEAMWGMYNGGGLCLNIGTNAIDLLSSGTFSTLLPSLKDLTRNQNTPFTLQLAPKEPPTFVIGAGTIDPNTGELIDPLMTLNWHNLDLNFYAFFEDRMVRIMTLNVDLAVPLALDVTDEGLVPVIGDLTEAFSRTEVLASELLTEEQAFIEGLLPSLVGIALPLLGDSLSSPIELPTFSGFALELDANSLMGIENNTMIGLFANIGLDPGGMSHPGPKVDTQAELIDLLLPPEALLVPGERAKEGERLAALMASRPVATFELSASLLGQRLDPGQASFSYRLDGGMWSTWRTDSTLVIDDPKLLLQGDHHLEVRARMVDAVLSIDKTPAMVTLPIDFQRPAVELTLAGDKVKIVGVDAVTQADELLYAVRRDGGLWSEWGATPEIDLKDSAADFAEIEVRVRDQAGHEGHVRRVFPLHGRVTRPSPEGACECAQVSPRGVGASPGWLLLAFGTLIGLRRREGRGGAGWLALIVVPLALLGGAGCDDDKPAGQVQACPGGCPSGEACVDGACAAVACQDDAQCAEGLSCVEGVCVALDRCTDSSDCPSGFVCLEGFCQSVGCSGDEDCGDVDCGGTDPFCDQGQCACEAPCAEGCGENEFCCESRNSCEALPDPCAAADCAPGFRGEIVSRGQGDAKTCEVTGAECSCVELDPLPEGDIGRFQDATVVGERVVVSAYNETYGDLMVGVLGQGDAFTWEFVDGVPEGAPVTGKLDGPRGGVGARGDNVGLYTSIAADPEGNLHVTYRDETNKDLKYAFGEAAGQGWSWSVFTIDAVGDTGLWSALSIGPDGFPALAYMARAVPVDDPARPVALSALRWAQAASARPADQGWAISDLDTQEIAFACGGGCPTGQKCRADTNTCERTLAGSRCDDACNAEQACFEGGCVDILEQPTIVSLPEGTGLFARVARFSNGDPAVVYYNRSGADLMFTRQQGGVWRPPVVLDGRDGQGNDTTDAGTFCDIAIDGSDRVHIAYVDAVTDDLRYIDLERGVSELVDDGVRVLDAGVSVHLVGDAASLLIDGQGNVRIAYQDATSHLLMLARRMGNTWQVLRVAGGDAPYTGSFGFYNQQIIAAGQPLTLTYRYQRQTSPPQNGLTVHRF